MSTEGPMTPARVIHAPQEARFADAHRIWQGIPSIERTPGGRLYADWYTGMDTERGGNFVLVSTSDDDGESWRSGVLAIEHDDPSVRCYDPCLWTDPLGRLWITWAQSREFFDGRLGVWAIISENPDADAPTWSEPRRIANGIMMNKPIVTRDGEWLFPCAIWSDHPPTEDHPDMAGERFSNVYASTDQGRTITYRGGADAPNRQFDEHMVVERRDGTLWMLVRAYDGIAEAFSEDGGLTWTEERRRHLDGPCSRFHIRRLRSGRLLMINHHGFPSRNSKDETLQQGDVKSWKGRSHLTALLSDDDGATWPHTLLLDERDGVSYPDATEGEDGTIYVIYDRDRVTAREILMSRFSEQDVLDGSFSERSVTAQVINRALALPEDSRHEVRVS